MNEQELIARLQRGDESAFEELIRLYEKKVYTLCVRMCGSAEDAEEAAQDTFLALWRGIDRFRQESSLSTWIYRLASNACIDLLRRSRRNIGGPSLDNEDAFVDAIDPAPQPQPSYAEISAVTRLGLGTVKSRISRGRALLRNYLSANGNFFEKASSKVTECNREEMSAR